MLLTVSIKNTSLNGPFISGQKSCYNLKAVGQTAQINMITCKNKKFMAESQYPKTRRSLLKTGLRLNYHFTIVFVMSIGDGSSCPVDMDQPFPSTPRFSLPENESGVKLIQLSTF